MHDLYGLTDAQMARPEPFFPKPHGKPHLDERRVPSGMILIDRTGLRWPDAPAAEGPPKAPYIRWKRWSEKGIFARMLLELADRGRRADTLMIGAAHLKTHRSPQAWA